MTRRMNFVGDIDRVCSAQINQIEVCGLKVPTEKAIESILNTLPDLESKLLFVVACNGWVKSTEVKYNPNKCISISESSIAEALNLEPKKAKRVAEEIKLHARLIEIDNILAEKIGFNFAFLRQSKALMSWHQSLRGGYTGIDHQKIRKGLSKYPLSIKSIPVKDYSHLRRVGKDETKDEYSIACKYFESVYEAVYNLVIINSTIRELTIEEANIMKIIATNIESDPPDLLYLYCCPFCGKYELLTKGKTPKSCGDCNNAYIKANREKNHPKRKWIHDITTLKPCIGGCGSDRKQLNSDRVCFGCYEPFS